MRLCWQSRLIATFVAMMYFERNPFFVRQFYKKSLCWKVPEAKKEVFLTFDDGPTPQLTREILAILDAYDAKATFFCVGENVKRYPQLFEELQNRGHGIGNHTFNHLDAWKTELVDYVANVEKAAEYIPSRLFRPPYGKIRPQLITKLKKQYRIVMWTVLSGDFDPDVDPQKCFENATVKTRSGDIIVFHDNEKARTNVLETLPRMLAFFAEKGIKVSALPKIANDF